jgi:D-threo-aldose 1-dehydrogenase
VFTPELEPNPFFVGAPAMNASFDWSRDAASRSVAESLARLGRSKLDIVLLHDPPPDELDAVLTGAYRALVELREQGAIQAIGAGVNVASDAIAVLERADLDCVLIAGRLTLLDQSAAPSLLPLCAERGISVIVGGVFNSGVLADHGDGARYDYRPVSQPILQRVEAIDAVCRSHGVPLAAAALQYPLRHSQVASVIPGMRSPRELDENLRLVQHPVPEELWVELESSGLVRSTAHG